MALVYEDRTRVLRRCFFDVQNEVGLGRQEEGYHQACKIWFQQNGVPFLSKPPHDLLFDGEVVHRLFPDFVVWDSITVELKAVPRKLAQSEFVQLFDYLKCREDRLGLLVNMGLGRVHIERIAYDPSENRLIEDWGFWTDAIEGPSRDVGTKVRASLIQIYSAHSTGYGEETTGKLLHFSLHQHRLPFVAAPISKAFFRKHLVDECPLDCLVIDNTVLLVVTALFDDNQFNINRGLSYMKALGISWGIAANFGRNDLEITGLHLRS